MNKSEYLKQAHKVQRALDRLYESKEKVPVSIVAQMIDGVIGQMMENEDSIIGKISKLDPDLAVSTVNNITGSIAFSLLASVECKSKAEVETLMKEFEIEEQTTVKYGNFIPDDIEEAGKA